MSYQDPSAVPQQVLEDLGRSHPEQEQFYKEISTLLSAKLYHQLTVAILDFTSKKSNLCNITDGNDLNNFFILYNGILSNQELKIKSKLNPLMLSRIAWNVAQTVVTSHPQKGQDVLLELIESFNTDEDSSSPSRSAFTMGTPPVPPAPHAKLFAESKLHLLRMEEESIKTFLKENSNLLKELSVSTESEVAAVHSAYYQTAMELYKRVGPADAFYTQAIQFLHYTPLSFVQNVKDLARDLCLAALVGKGVYNLGTVVYENGALLASLQGESDGFLVELMESSASGDVRALKILEQHRAQLEGNGCDIKGIQEKIMLLGLVNMVFEKDSGERTMKFVDIAERLQVDIEQVEWIVMKSLSLGLIKGTMDQVDGVVNVTWVMPRVLDEKNMKTLAHKFGEWAEKVGETKDFVGERIPSF